MYILGIESSCDETSAAVVEMEAEKCRIASNIVASQIETHRLYGGVVPEIASRAHIEAVTGITHQALDTAGITLSQVGAVAVTAAPGLIGALLVGVNFAKSLAFANHIPLVPVNHIKAHVAAAYLSDPQLKPPFLAVVVSGGHTSLFEVRSYTDFVEIGATRDDAAGEAFDKIGRVIGLPYPGGAAIDKLAYEGDPLAIKLPSPALGGDTLDFSFSGLKTAALNYINTCRQNGTEVPRADLAASYTHAIVEGVAQKTEAALRQTGYKTVVLAGGVAANSHLRARLERVAADCKARLSVPPISLCGDNGAMVAAAGYFAYLAGQRAGTELNASAEDHPAWEQPFVNSFFEKR
ncbi:MAG: tRNA (adenosine(37)-N6)-threonylcarbamoyltransferase complex transferase subunit TsaD [Clostridia bacterium]|nr:tRNA (adenosine(37)-N6)-threonylcarbamoyltransferase complex transferase subunit TsaD [Clostridia bacterium]